MQFGIFHAHQLPRPWLDGDEHKLIEEALAQIVLADKLGLDYAWVPEHHFLEEYSHSSASDVFLAALAVQTKNIRIGFGIRQVIANYNHPARTAETIAMIDHISNGRLEFGIGEGATRMELSAFGIPAKEKRAMALEAAEQIANMMVMEPYPGFEGKSFSMPCRNVLPKPMQRPHPPMWMACTNRDTIRVAAANGLGALSFNFLDPAEAKAWSDIYYGIIKSEECVPLGHSVNANLAVVSAFCLHSDRDEAGRRGQEHFEFFGYSQGCHLTRDVKPGRTNFWPEFLEERRANRVADTADAAIGLGDLKKLQSLFGNAPGIGTPDEFRKHVRVNAEGGVDQYIVLPHSGRAEHAHVCESLELLARDVLPEFREVEAKRQRKKQDELAPYIEAALKRKKRIRELEDHEIPAVPAAKPKKLPNLP